MEVLAIDDAAPPPPKPEPTPAPDPAWRQWQGRVKQLDARWWPLWLILGLIAIVLFLTVGLFFGIILLFLKLISRVLHGLTRLFTGGSSSTSIR